MRVIRQLIVLVTTLGLWQGAGARAAESEDAARLLGEAKALREKGRFLQARPLAERTVALLETGQDPLRLADALHELGWVLEELGEYKQAVQLQRRVLQIREERLGPDHLAVTAPLVRIGRNLSWLRAYEEGSQVLSRALRLREERLGPEHPGVAEVLCALGSLYGATGNYARSLPIRRRALAILEKDKAPDPYVLAWVLNGLAGDLRSGEGRIDEAVQLYLRAIYLMESTLGVAHPLYGILLRHLGWLYVLQGDLDRAEPLIRRALEVHQAALGPTHWMTAKSMGDLASLHRSRGEYDQAEHHYRRAVEVFERTLGPEHNDSINALRGLGEVYRQKGDLDRALPLLRRALSFRERVYGPADPRIAESLNSLALIHHARGQLDQAEPLYRSAIGISEDTPTRLLDLPMALTSLSHLLLTQGRLPEALPLMERALRLSEKRLRSERRTLSDARLLSLLDSMRHDEEVLASAVQKQPAHPEARRLALAAALLRKGQTLDELAATSQAMARLLSPEDQRRLAELRTHHTRLASLSAAGPGQMAPARYQALVKEHGAGAEALEQEMAARSFRFREQRQLPGPEDIVSRVAARLPPDGVLVEFVTSRSFGPRREPGPEHLMALVLLPDEQTAAVDSGERAAIEAAVGRLLAALRDPRAAHAGVTEEVGRLLMAPLRERLAGRRHLYLSAEGPLHFVPFAVLTDGGQPLLARHELTYLTSGRDLLRISEVRPAMTVAVLADPLFAQAAVGPSNRATALRDRGLVLGNLAPLPGTRQEADAIRAMLPAAKVLLGAEASEGALLDLKAPGILHVATHGIYVNEEAPAAGLQRGFQVKGVVATNPLLRSALVLAGAQAQQQGDGPDGLATALEISGMDLWGTQLVVLSACETGRGQARQGQGVYGLRRALSIAGAETLVTSLWKVDDATTRDLMTDFYRGLVSGLGRGEAMTAAMTATRKRKPHPYYWAPFIVIGQPGPLRGIGARP